MKNSIKIATSFLVFVFVFTSFCQGQEEVRIKRSKDLYFKGESKKAEVKIKSTKDYNYLVINLNCQLRSGDVKVEIIDPKGKKEGNFTVKTDHGTVVGDSTKVHEQVSGEMSKVFALPKEGEWIVKATPTGSRGLLSINIIQGWEPRIDMIDLRSLKNQ